MILYSSYEKDIVFSIALCFSVFTYAQITLDYFLPKDVTYNKEVPTTKQFIGHEVGEWHWTHDKLYFYMLELAKISERAIWYGTNKVFLNGVFFGQIMGRTGAE